MGWTFSRGLEKLRQQINALYPNRSKVSDGTIGDAAHSSRTSDHNPNAKGIVCAWDVTHDPANGLDCSLLAAQLQASRDPRIDYVIFRRKIMSSSVAPWTWRYYGGANPHNKHLHISIKDAVANEEGEWNLSQHSYVQPVVNHDASIVEFGDRGFAVSKLQIRLRELGFLKDAPDGIFGRDTKLAVIAFQKSKGLGADGVVGSKTWAALGE
jgi:hypothetical protein